jgi:hypothetical protein
MIKEIDMSYQYASSPEDTTLPPQGEQHHRVALPRDVRELQRVVYNHTTEKQRIHKGMGNDQGRYDSVPYAIIRELWQGTCEENILKHRAYAAARSHHRETNPYNDRFGTGFLDYIGTLNVALDACPFPFQITDRYTLAGYREYALTRVDLSNGGIQVHLPFPMEA